MKKLFGLLIFTILVSFLEGQIPETSKREKTSFQTSGVWKPQTDLRSDVAIIYGTIDQNGISFEERVETWRKKGYITHFMTGIAWGDYADYFNGEWDGKKHWEDGQVRYSGILKETVENLGAGDTVWHHKGVPYIVPTNSFIEYIKNKHIKRVIDAGIDAIYLEEPEFWAKSGYSEAFRKVQTKVSLKLADTCWQITSIYNNRTMETWSNLHKG